MRLSNLMQRNVEVINADATVREAARRMSALGIGALPVREGGRIAGMLTDRDVVVRTIARGDDPDRARAGDAMTRTIASCYEDEDIDEAAEKMSECQVQRLIVVDHDEKLVGIVSLRDLLSARGHAPAVARTLEEIKAPTKPSAAGARSP